MLASALQALAVQCNLLAGTCCMRAACRLQLSCKAHMARSLVKELQEAGRVPVKVLLLRSLHTQQPQVSGASVLWWQPPCTAFTAFTGACGIGAVVAVAMQPATCTCQDMPMQATMLLYAYRSSSDFIAVSHAGKVPLSLLPPRNLQAVCQRVPVNRSTPEPHTEHRRARCPATCRPDISLLREHIPQRTSSACMQLQSVAMVQTMWMATGWQALG